MEPSAERLAGGLTWLPSDWQADEAGIIGLVGKCAQNLDRRIGLDSARSLFYLLGDTMISKQEPAPGKSSSQSNTEQVEGLLDALYAAQSQGQSSTDALDAFLDTFETWLTPEGLVKVNMLFSRVDLNRAPEALGILLLATTRLTRSHFVERDAFLDRFAQWLVGCNGRTSEYVCQLLVGLRE